MNKQHLYVLSIIALLCWALSACSKRQADELISEAETPQKITYSNFVAGFLQVKCANCHAAGKAHAAIWTFNGLSSVTANQSRIKNAVLVAKSMPIGTRLTAEELTKLQAWFDANMPE